MKWILLCHNFCSWHHQQSFFTLLKLKCRCGHVRKFENQSILTREVIVTLFYKDLGRKTDCFEGWSWFKFDNLWLVLSMTLKFYSSVAKIKVKNKGQKVSRTNSYRGIQSKECYFMFTYTFLSFLSKNLCFHHFNFFFYEVSKFRNRILIIQKLKLMIRNCQWNCMGRKQPSAHLRYYVKTQARGIFRTLSNIYDRVICKHR